MAVNKSVPFFLIFFLAAWCLPLAPLAAAGTAPGPAPAWKAPVLLYHRFGPFAADGMTVTTAVFESHLKFLAENGFAVVPLRDLVDKLLGGGAPPPRTAAIAVDDGHRTVYTEMLPVIRKYRVPVTLFIYPSAISNASYAMTWEELRELKRTGLFDIQSHSYWHPNFKAEKRKGEAADYLRLVDMQLTKSRQRLEKELGDGVDLLAWPFGIYDDQLMERAAAAGYRAAFSLERRPVSPSERAMALPRFLMTDADRGKRFGTIVLGAQKTEM